MPPEIPIVFCFDAGYANYAAISTFSLSQNSKSALKIFWVVPSRDAQIAFQLQKLLAGFKIQITILSVGEDRFSMWKVSHHFSRAMYLKLLIPELLSEDKAIYIDCDTIVLSDLSALYAMDLQDRPIAGVIDLKGGKTSKVPRDHRDTYINSGVMLMNLDMLRRDNFLAKAEQIYTDHLDTITWPDQCIINKYAEGKKLVLDPQWNRQVFSGSIKDDQLRQAISPQMPGIVHFVGGIKPWQEWCHPEVARFWWGYANQVKIPNFAPVKMTSINQARSLAAVLDLNEKFKEASELKGEIIQTLLEHLAPSQA